VRRQGERLAGARREHRERELATQLIVDQSATLLEILQQQFVKRVCTLVSIIRVAWIGASQIFHHTMMNTN
jgi:hypothetical protein